MNKNLLTVEEAKKRLAEWDYVTLELGSYKRFIYRRWHEYFVKNGLVKQSYTGQFTITNAQRFCEWIQLYDDWMNAREFPQSYTLTPEQAKKIREAGLFGADYKYNEWKKKQTNPSLNFENLNGSINCS